MRIWQLHPRPMMEHGVDITSMSFAILFCILIAGTVFYMIVALLFPDQLLPSEYSDSFRWKTPISVLADPGPAWSPLRTLGFAVVVAIVEMVLAVVVLQLCDLRRPSILSVALMIALPLSLGDSAVSLLWYPFLVGDDSYLNVVRHFFGMGSINFCSANAQAALGVPWLWVSVGAVEVWRWTPFCLGVLLAAIATIPRDELDYAWCSGLSRYRLMRYVIWPHIRVIFGALLLFQVASTLQIDNLYTLLAGESQLVPMTGPTIVRTALSDRQLFNALVFGLYTAITFTPLGIAFAVLILRYKKDTEMLGAD